VLIAQVCQAREAAAEQLSPALSSAALLDGSAGGLFRRTAGPGVVYDERLPGAAAYADVRRPAYAAAGLAFASAAVSLFWTLGGTLLLDTVGGAIEDLARDRSAVAIAVGIAVILVKAAAGLLALALTRPWRTAVGARLLLAANALASLALILWGGINVAVGALVLGEVIVPADDVDEHALRWHVFVWDLWFLVWGLSLAVATARYRRHVPAGTPAPGP
jgi:Protein of unknown function (DUF3995)